MCLYGFVFALSLSLFVGEELAPPVAPNTSIPTTIAKPHYPSKSTISLPPLSKVRCCRPKKFGRLPDGLLYTHRASQSPQPSQKHINRFAPHHALASLVKGEVLSPEKIRATTGGIALHPPSLSIPTTFSKAHQPLRPAPRPCLPRQR